MNEVLNVKFKKLNVNAVAPTRGSEFSAGYDLYACIDEQIEIKPFETVKIPTGISLEFPPNVVALIFARSGLSCKNGIAPANKVGVCDSDYRGEYIVFLHNHSEISVTINKKDRIAQLILMPFYAINFIEAENLTETNRGENGFGSTGKWLIFFKRGFKKTWKLKQI